MLWQEEPVKPSKEYLDKQNLELPKPKKISNQFLKKQRDKKVLPCYSKKEIDQAKSKKNRQVLKQNKPFPKALLYEKIKEQTHKRFGSIDLIAIKQNKKKQQIKVQLQKELKRKQEQRNRLKKYFQQKIVKIDIAQVQNKQKQLQNVKKISPELQKNKGDANIQYKNLIEMIELQKNRIKAQHIQFNHQKSDKINFQDFESIAQQQHSSSFQKSKIKVQKQNPHSKNAKNPKNNYITKLDQKQLQQAQRIFKQKQQLQRNLEKIDNLTKKLQILTVTHHAPINKQAPLDNIFVTTIFNLKEQDNFENYPKNIFHHTYNPFYLQHSDCSKKKQLQQYSQNNHKNANINTKANKANNKNKITKIFDDNTKLILVPNHYRKILTKDYTLTYYSNGDIKQQFFLQKNISMYYQYSKQVNRINLANGVQLYYLYKEQQLQIYDPRKSQKKVIFHDGTIKEINIEKSENSQDYPQDLR